VDRESGFKVGLFISLLVTLLACQTVSGIVDQTVEDDIGEIDTIGEGGFSDGEGVSQDLSPYCESMVGALLPGVSEASGKILVEGMQDYGGGRIECSFEPGGMGVWCEWSITYNKLPVHGCKTTPSPSEDESDRKRCEQKDTLLGQFCGEYDGVSITGITKGIGTRVSYPLNQSSGRYEHTEEHANLSGVMSCNLMANGKCEGRWSVTSVYGDWWIRVP
jgi:hypothetical protein